jgi:quinol-cytochrome oxidoreductase complex cytochrome b subunit
MITAKVKREEEKKKGEEYIPLKLGFGSYLFILVRKFILFISNNFEFVLYRNVLYQFE